MQAAVVCKFGEQHNSGHSVSGSVAQHAIGSATHVAPLLTSWDRQSAVIHRSRTAVALELLTAANGLGHVSQLNCQRFQHIIH